MFAPSRRVLIEKARAKSEREHKSQLNTRTETWGSVKFKPQAYRSHKPAFTPPDPQTHAKPWQHVKNDIIDDSEEMSHAARLDVDSEDARQFMQQRKQNHRRNIIESNRLEPTKWETFDEEQSSTSKEKPKEKSRLWQCDKSKGELPTDVKNFTFKERNFFKRKLTMGLKAVDRVDLDGAIEDLTRNKSQLERVNTGFKKKRPELTDNPVKTRGGANGFQRGGRGGGNGFQRGGRGGGTGFQRGGRGGGNGFQRGGRGGRNPFQKRKPKKPWEEY